MKSRSTKLFNLMLPLVMALSMISTPRVATAAETDDDLYNQRYRSNYDVTPGRFYTGKSPYMKSRGEAAKPQPAPRVVKVQKAPTPAPAPSAQSCSEIRTGLIHMTKNMPAEASLGQEFMYELNPTAVDCVGQVVITDMIPEGTSYVRSQPKANVQGNMLTWSIPTMESGETIPIKVWLKAEKEGQLGSCAMVSAWPRTCGSTFVGKPVLFLSKAGPESALLGADVAYNIQVRNDGSAVARDVVVTDKVPAGLTHSSGRNELRYEVGDLAPKQAKTINVQLKAAQRGRHCNVAVASSSNAGEATAEACTTIVQPGLEIAKSGPEEMLLQKRADYGIQVANTGDTDLQNVVVTDSAPSGTSIVAAPGATINGNQATWRFATLTKGEKKSLKVTLTSQTPGRHCNTATVSASGGLRESSEACTLWKGLSAILIEVVDNPDPIQIDEFTTYNIRVTNQGTAEDTNIGIVATFPAQVTPVSASSGQVAGKTVTFPTVPSLAPKQSFTYTIKAKGANEGDGRIRVEMSSDQLTSTVTEQESTRVY